MAGCAAAHALRKKGHRVTIVEQNDRLGGRMYSEKVGDLTFEMGAVFLTNFYVNTLAFLHETGLDKDLQVRKSETFIIRDGRPHSAKKLSTYIGSSWLSLGAKARLLAEGFKLLPAWNNLTLHEIWKGEKYDTQSVEQSLSDKYGRELVNYLFEPVLNGYLYWSPKRTSKAFLAMLLKAALLQRHTYMLKNGLRQIPEKAAEGCEVLLSSRVESVKREKSGLYRVMIQKGNDVHAVNADGIVCATTATAVPKMISDLTKEQAEFFSTITYSSTVVAAYRMQRSKPLPTYAYAYPLAEGQSIVAMTVSSDTSLVASMVKVYASGTIGKELGEKSDKEVHSILTAPIPLDVGEAFKVGEYRIQRWQEAIPEFDVGYLHKLRRFADGKIEDSNSNVVFAGDYIGGPFVEGAFTSGIRAAERLHSRLSR